MKAIIIFPRKARTYTNWKKYKETEADTGYVFDLSSKLCITKPTIPSWLSLKNVLDGDNRR